MNEYGLVLLAVTAFFGFAYFKKQKAKRPTKAATPWIIKEGSGVLTPQGAGWTLDIPAAPDYSAYVAWLDEPALREGQSIRIRYRVEGALTATEYPDSPADCGVMIQRRGDNLTARDQWAGYRWFSGVHMPLTAGEHEFTLRLDTAEWGPVMGGPQAASFADCLREADSINIVMGGAGGRGHGVYGPAQFTLHSLEIV